VYQKTWHERLARVFFFLSVRNRRVRSNAKKDTGSTPLAAAKSSTKETNQGIIDLLQKNGAKE
jgi:hypothetical protein